MTASTIDTELGEKAVALVEKWLAAGDGAEATGSAALLAEVLKDKDGLDFTLGFVDRVIRPEDDKVAADSLKHLARHTPGFLPWYMRSAVKLGGAMGQVLPSVVIPIARRAMRDMVGHLIIDSRPGKLGKAIAKLKTPGIRLNLNLLGEAVLGNDESDSRLEGTRKMLARDDVDYVSIKVSSIVNEVSLWGFDETVERVTRRLTPLYELAANSPLPKFINLDMEEYHDLDLTIAVFERILDQPQLLHLEAGIVLQAYLPDALGALQGLTEWSKARRARGGAAIKVRLVKGANLAMEHVEAAVRGWPLAPYGRKQDTDTNYKRVLQWALTPEVADAVRLGVAGHNLFDIAYARLLSVERGVTDQIEFEMLLGMAEGQAAAISDEVGGLLLYTPVVHPDHFDAAISYLVRRLEENSSTENFMSAVFELTTHRELFERERDRFLASLAEVDTEAPARNRQQNRLETPNEPPATTFANEPDTDPSLPDNRAWGRQILSRAKSSTLGNATIEAAAVTDAKTLDDILAGLVAAQPKWAALGGSGRADVLHRAARGLAAARGDLIEVAAVETGKTIDQSDPEVSEATDFASFYAECARELDSVDGAEFVPSKLTVVTPPWNFPIAIPTGSMLSALAAGSAVVVKPAPQARRCAAVIVDTLHAAGIPRDVLRLVDVDEGELGKQLVSDSRVDRVILTGGYETAKLFRSWRPDLPLLAETSGKNSIIVTPSADLDLAVADVVHSAFGHAGQKCSAASTVILVGSVATSTRFRNQLVDAVSSLRVDYPTNPVSQMGPVVEPVSGKLKEVLTTLDDGETWAVEPRQLDDTGRLWSPGVKAGVKPGSAYHLTEYFGPVLGVMTAETLKEAIELQNAPVYGLTAGLHTLDPDDLAYWLPRVQAGNLYVNRGITGAIVRRQPFGGWKRSSVGAGAKAGGPNYVVHLGSWHPAERRSTPAARPEGRAAALLAASGTPQSDGYLAVSAADDQAEWEREFGVASDVSALGLERNVFRYLPMEITVRLGENGSPTELTRVLLAGARAGSTVHVSTGVPLPDGFVKTLTASGASYVEMSDRKWLDSLAATGPGTGRIRLIGMSAADVADALGGDPDVAVFADPVTTAGRLELLPFMHEQAVTIAAHRFGNPDAWSDGII
ncbi:bifunctional proline dehydrogenase/L-glutamate gamma-semialdehyde dehydrogenase [Spelaeicoccus albus]|uniref:L-glutamate gamma-semialdehyde dehydrogenase n=1 Tax=Spelaeicoccus albus TaxID=1280376 RepID=A0A7Z0ABZ6_9MICO|nr:bifunctional proline dehydrogenase/L-glutamate gamma-semialdehyde dehydrogenase [Spelaeicoccus albus]NYI67305.1 RHH-type proline utilization regulon transcriptional repressor/proline dehydrogenase/delta 1-pyrroline-5-carboxylate dehydrogenase [Spelaeicoccus albus]